MDDVELAFGDLDPKGSAHKRLVPGEGWEPA